MLEDKYTLKLLGAGSIRCVSMWFCIKGVTSKLLYFVAAGVIGTAIIHFVNEDAM